MTTYLYDGAKAVPLNQLPASAWTWYTPHLTDEERDGQIYYQKVPWLSRAVKIRADAIANLPFNITNKSGDVIDSSKDWQNKVGFMPNPQKLLWLIEASLTILGKAYLFSLRNRSRPLDLRYIVATTVEPIMSIEKGLTGFVRRIGKQEWHWDVEECIHFWLLDPYIELGPGNNSPVMAAMNAAGVLHNVDKFAESFFERGAIKVTLLTTEGTPTKEARDDIKTWWRKAAAGIQNAFASRILQGNIKPVVIGEGIKELSDNQLTKEKREDIATALGVPQTKLWSSTASGLGGGGVVTQDDKNLYQDTIVPESAFIASIFNEQVYDPLDMTMTFLPETLDVFQTDEKERAQAFSLYVNSGMPVPVVGRMLGVELDPKDSWEAIEKEKEERRQEMADNMANAKPKEEESQSQPPPPNQQAEAQRAAMLADLRRWRTKARKAGGSVPFESQHIPDHLAELVNDSIEAIGVDGAFSFLKQAGSLEAEARIQAKVLKVLKNWKNQFVAIIMENGMPPYDELQAALRASLGPEISAIATEQALRVAAEVGVEFDPAMVNELAAEWARTYTYELVTGLTNTTRNVVRGAIEDYFATPGMTRGQLEALLEPAFGTARAEMIAVTETTRAYSQSMNQYQRMIKEEAGIVMERVWQTNNDELVCPVCGPLHGQPEVVWADQFGGGPPAHVRCRCSTTLRLKR